MPVGLGKIKKVFWECTNCIIKLNQVGFSHCILIFQGSIRSCAFLVLNENPYFSHYCPTISTFRFTIPWKLMAKNVPISNTPTLIFLCIIITTSFPQSWLLKLGHLTLPTPLNQCCNQKSYVIHKIERWGRMGIEYLKRLNCVQVSQLFLSKIVVSHIIVAPGEKIEATLRKYCTKMCLRSQGQQMRVKYTSLIVGFVYTNASLTISFKDTCFHFINISLDQNFFLNQIIKLLLLISLEKLNYK